MVGKTLSHYEILAELSRGGMGIVYKALDLKLKREVAIKVLPPELVSDPERKRRFVQEAQAAAALKHPNIAVVYEVDEFDGETFIAMELIDGQKLSDMLMGRPLPVDKALDIAIELTDGLARAHDKGIVHRDLKPANIMMTEDGHPKIIDFGLVKLVEPVAGVASSAETAIRIETGSHVVLGTVSYMSPEQALGRPVDRRSDLFSLGVTLYEMTTGQKPFTGTTPMSVLDAILHQVPTFPRELNATLPPSLDHIIRKLLEKEPGLRYQTADELLVALKAERRLEESSSGAFLAARLRRPQWSVPLVALALVSSIAAVRWFQQASGARWAREVALPEIVQLVEAQDFTSAHDLAREAESFIAGDPILERLLPDFSRWISVETTPPGADVFIQRYDRPEGSWEHFGKTQLTAVRLPREFYRWRIEKDGFDTHETVGFWAFASTEQTLSIALSEVGKIPSEMVPVEERSYYPDFPGLEHVGTQKLESYLIDRFEVTNKQYEQFVDAGGYQDRKFWKHAFMKEGKELSWEQAMAELVDSTGRLGPSTWELGYYPEGQDDHPVTGVSWYEAAAFAGFAGMQMPTLYHWGRAAGTWLGDHIVRVSNFQGDGVAPVGTFRGTSPVGAYDMAGNVKEWCWNSAGVNRYIVGGAWNEPVYMFNHPDAQDTFRRLPTYGFRCMKLLTDKELSPNVAGPLVGSLRDFSAVEPVSAEVFQIYKRLFSYDKTELDAVIEWADDSAEHWRTEVVSFDAAYGSERVIAYLYLPKNVSPPYQTVVYFPGAEAIHISSSEDLRAGPSGTRKVGSEGGGLGGIEFLVRSGRAILYPVYKSTYERGDELKSNYPNDSTFFRDHLVMWAKDLGRSIDYLESRSDISDRIAYYGYSWGAQNGAILVAVEDRIACAILVAGGFKQQATPPEVDQAIYAPFVEAPTLMLNGRYDFFFQLEKAQLPMFELLGPADEHKRHVVFDSGHVIPRREGIIEISKWLDTYLGPVH